MAPQGAQYQQMPYQAPIQPAPAPVEPAPAPVEPVAEENNSDNSN